MQLTRSIDHSRLAEISQSLLQESVVGVTLGNFDGMHIGHQALFERLDAELNVLAEFRGRKPYKVLLTFHPHPRQALSGLSRAALNDSPEHFQLESFRNKVEYAQSCGFDAFIALRFSAEFAALSPEQFLELCFVEGLHIGAVVVGHDWTFGAGRSGNVELLSEYGHQNGFGVHVVNPVVLDGRRVSSGWLKEAVKLGDLETTRSLLGRDFCLSGRVRHGEKRGRELGFPTANLEFLRQVLPSDGVYATRVRVNEKVYDSVTNIGVRPTFGKNGRVVEAHIFSKNELELYGQRVDVQFVERIRNERKFSSVEELKSAISADAESSRDILSKNPGGSLG